MREALLWQARWYQAVRASTSAESGRSRLQYLRSRFRPDMARALVLAALLQAVSALRAGHVRMTAPAPSLSPVQVVQAQLSALQKGDVQRCFEFASPANKKATGPWQRFEIMVRQTPAYAPLVCCTRFEVVGALPLGSDAYKCRARVWPAGGSSAPFAVATPVLDYDWMLSRQREGPMQGCWAVDSVLPDSSPRDAWEQAAEEKED